MTKTCIFVATFLLSACALDPTVKELPRTLEGYQLLAPTPDGSVEMPNGTLRYIDESRDSLVVSSFDGRIFNIAVSKRYRSSGELAEIIESAERRYGKPTSINGRLYTYTDARTRVNLHIIRGKYTLSVSDLELIETALGSSR